MTGARGWAVPVAGGPVADGGTMHVLGYILRGIAVMCVLATALTVLELVTAVQRAEAAAIEERASKALGTLPAWARKP